MWDLSGGSLGGMPISSNPPLARDLSELFHRAFRSFRQSWSDQLTPFELTPHQFRALHSLARSTADRAAPDGLRLKEIAERLHIAARSATEVIDHLEAKSLVTRCADPVDRRAILVALTPEGRTLTDEVQIARREHTQTYFGRLDAQERAELARILGKLAGSPER